LGGGGTPEGVRRQNQRKSMHKLSEKKGIYVWTKKGGADSMRRLGEKRHRFGEKMSWPTGGLAQIGQTQSQIGGGKTVGGDLGEGGPERGGGGSQKGQEKQSNDSGKRVMTVI